MKFYCLLIALVALCYTSACGTNEPAITYDSTDQEEEQWLFSFNGKKATFAQGAKESFTIVIESPDSPLAYTDRPDRKAVHIPDIAYLETYWSFGLSQVPPNAVLSGEDADGNPWAQIIEITKAPTYDEDSKKLTITGQFLLNDVTAPTFLTDPDVSVDGWGGCLSAAYYCPQYVTRGGGELLDSMMGNLATLSLGTWFLGFGPIITLGQYIALGAITTITDALIPSSAGTQCKQEYCNCLFGEDVCNDKGLQVLAQLSKTTYRKNAEQIRAILEPCGDIAAEKYPAYSASNCQTAPNDICKEEPCDDSCSLKIYFIEDPNGTKTAGSFNALNDIVISNSLELCEKYGPDATGADDE